MFLTAYDKSHKIETEDNGSKVLVVGDEEWPMPIPIVPAPHGWWFDTDAGDDEIINRRIGRNELSVMEVMRAYLDAQVEYSDQVPHDGTKHEYAQHLVSSRRQA